MGARFSYPHCRAACRRAGFTLVEVLVALFVVALGIAGAAALQTRAAHAGGEAARYADGVQLASSLAERMRANPVAMALPDGANPYLQFDFQAAGAAPLAAPACYLEPGCTADQLAGFDLSETRSALASRFPGGRIRVCRDAGLPGPSGVAPWECAGGPQAPVAIKLGWPGKPGDAPAPVVELVLGAGAP